jgi:hypothetical protein
MKTQSFDIGTFLILGLISFIILCPNFAIAQGNIKHDKVLVIHVDPITHCATAVLAADNKQDCKLESPNPCKKDRECICSKKEKYISWTTNTRDKFDINFTDGTPFKKCRYTSESAGNVRCKIKNAGDFYYEVNVEVCASNPYDPRIIVR